MVVEGGWRAGIARFGITIVDSVMIPPVMTSLAFLLLIFIFVFQLAVLTGCNATAERADHLGYNDIRTHCCFVT